MPHKDPIRAKEYRKQWKMANKAKIRSQAWKIKEIKNKREKNKIQNKEYIEQYKANRSCKYCPESDPVCLTFHHRDPKDKKFEISQTGMRTLTNLINEISKCDLVCANCHFKIHYKKGFLEQFV